MEKQEILDMVLKRTDKERAKHALQSEQDEDEPLDVDALIAPAPASSGGRRGASSSGGRQGRGRAAAGPAAGKRQSRRAAAADASTAGTSSRSAPRRAKQRGGGQRAAGCAVSRGGPQNS